MYDEKEALLCSPMSMSAPLMPSPASRRSLLTSFLLVFTAVYLLIQATSHGVRSSYQARSDAQTALQLQDPSEKFQFTSYFHDFEDVYQRKSNYTTTLVLGRLKSEGRKTQWAYQAQGIDRHAVYIVDDINAEFHLDRNHGRESMVYLKYILDHYDNLTDITFFFHAQEKTWHNNIILGESSLRTLNLMNREWIMRQGYVNTRCDHWPGCPSWVVYNPTNAEFELDPHHGSDMFSPKLKDLLWPDEPMEHFPRYFAQTCCSQFAVSADAIRAHPRSTYEALYKWIDGEWLDQWSGRAMEMIWQYVFLRRGVVCPSMVECYCRTYGVMCDATREEIELIDTWNMFRNRGEELQWQVEFRGKEIRKAKGTDHIPWEEQDDAQFQSISLERDEIQALSRKYKKQVIRKFGADDSDVDW